MDNLDKVLDQMFFFICTSLLQFFWILPSIFNFLAQGRFFQKFKLRRCAKIKFFNIKVLSMFF